MINAAHVPKLTGHEEMRIRNSIEDFKKRTYIWRVEYVRTLRMNEEYAH